MSSTEYAEYIAPPGEESAAIGRSRPVPGIYWGLGIFVGATATYLISRGVYNALNIGGGKTTSSLSILRAPTLGDPHPTTFPRPPLKPFFPVSAHAGRGGAL